MLRLIFKRIRYNLGLTISTEIGIVAVLALVVTIPLFTNAVMTDILREQLLLKAEKNRRSLFSLHAYYPDNSSYSPLTIQGMKSVSDTMNRELETGMGLSVDRIITETNTKQILWKPVKTRSISQPYQYLYLRLISNSLLPQGADFVEGTVPSMEDYLAKVGSQNRETTPIPVAVQEKLADENFINVGDILQANEFSIEVVGIFRVKNNQDQGWFYSPDTTFSGSVWVPVEFFVTVLPELLDRPQSGTSWYAIVSDSSIRYHQSRQYSRDMVRLESILKNMAPNMRVDYSPLDMLQIYDERLKSMTVLFYAAGVPMIVLAVLFISLTASIGAQQNTGEIVTMRTRGVNLRQAILMNIVETLILVLIAIPGVIIVSWLGTWLMGQSQSFLQFSTPDTSVQAFSLTSVFFNLIGTGILPWLGIMLAVIIIARIAPILVLWRGIIIDLKQRMGRQAVGAAGQPIWQRYYLDFFLLIPSIYVYITRRGIMKPVGYLTDLRITSTSSLPELFIRPETGSISTPNLTYDPLELLSASLFAIACCMISLRILPFILRSLRYKPFGGINRITKPWSYMALQEIIRRPQDHTSTLLLIMIALSLSIYSASLARTLSLWITQSRSYASGADLVISEYTLDFGSGPSPAGVPSSPETTAASPANSFRGGKALVSLDRHLDVPGIENHTFVGNYACKIVTVMGDKECGLLGIDRLSFPSVAFFRDDFLVGNGAAPTSLGALMNALAVHPSGVLAPQSLLDQSGLTPGDSIKIKIYDSSLGLSINREFVIAGAYQYFPTVYPNDPPTLIMSLDTLFGSYDAIVGYDVWLRLQSGADSAAVIQDIRKLALKDLMAVQVQSDSLSSIEAAKSQPEWMGLFGVLNLGFLLTSLLPGIGFILYSFASLRKRTIELGILQAIGLSIRQLINSLVFEQLGLMSIAIIGGILIGYLTSLIFLPILQASIIPGDPIPPFQVQSVWVEFCLVEPVFLHRTQSHGLLHNPAPGQDENLPGSKTWGVDLLTPAVIIMKRGNLLLQVWHHFLAQQADASRWI